MKTAYGFRTVLVVLVCVFGVLGQAPSGNVPNSVPIVSIPVSVTNHSGAPVTGLNAASFSLSEDGQNRAPESAREVAPVMVGKGNRIAFVVLDVTVRAQPDTQGETRSVCLQLLASAVTKGTLISLSEMALDGLHVIHEIKTPSSILVSALLQLDDAHHFLTHRDQLQAMRTAAEDNSLLAAETGRLRRFRRGTIETGKARESFLAQLRAFQEMAGALQRAEGRKTVIWLTRYFPIEVIGDKNSPINTDSRFPASASIDYQRTVNLLNAAQISIFPLQIEGPEQISPIQVEASERTRVVLEQFAESTGGTVLGASDSLENVVNHAEDLSTSYYLLTFHPEIIKTGQRWTNLKVRLNDRSLRVTSQWPVRVSPVEVS